MGQSKKLIAALCLLASIVVFQNCSSTGGDFTAPGASTLSSVAPTATPFLSGPLIATPTPTATPIPVVPMTPTPIPNNDAQAMAGLTQLIATLAPQLAQLNVDPSSFYGVSPAAIIAGTATPASISASAANIMGQINDNSGLLFFVDDGTLNAGISQAETAIGQLQALQQTPLSPLVADEVTANIQILQTLVGAMSDNL